MEGEKNRGTVNKVKDVAAEAFKPVAGAAAAVVMTRAVQGALALGSSTTVLLSWWRSSDG